MDGEGGEDESLEKSNEDGHMKGTESTSKAGQKSSLPTRRPSTQLWLHAALMSGRDFLYAVEVVLVTPIMLQLGMEEHLYSYIWFCSPTLGLLLGPLMGNWSDQCTSKWGRRRPFILGFVVGTMVGLTLMIFSRDLALFLTDSLADQRTLGLVFGIIGTQVMDFCLDQLETPLRAFTLDVCSPSDQQRAFALQAVFMGFGAALGFIIDGIKWEEILGFQLMGLQIKVVYLFAIVFWVTTAAMTLFSIKEVHWKKPRRKHKALKSSISLQLNGEHKNSAGKAREIASDPGVSTKREGKMKHGRAVDNGTNSWQTIESEQKLLLSSGHEVPTVLMTSNLNTRREEYSDAEETAGPEEEKPLKYFDVEEANAGFLHSSPAVRSITLLPRISLCKSVFMTMSCPEGLNETSSSSMETSFLTTDDDSSDNDDDSARAHPDEDTYGSSMPNLSHRGSSSTHPATFLEILRNKIHILSPNITNAPSEGTAVDPVNCAILGESSKNGVHYNKNLPKTDFSDKNSYSNQNHINIDETFSETSKNNFCVISAKNDEIDRNGNVGAVRQLTFDPDEEVKESLIEKNGEKPKRRGRRKKKKVICVDEGEAKPVSMRALGLSILTMPMKLRWLCLSLLISYMGIEIELLWYTSIFGSVVYKGDPAAPANSTDLQLYNDGVHMACWGLTIYAVAVMIFSVAMEHFNILSKISLRILYSGGQLVTSISTAVMFMFPNKYVILMLSWSFGITVSVTCTIPYVLVGKYHEDKAYVMKSPGSTKRGYGIDCAILACQMYAGNLLYAAISGPVIAAYGGIRVMFIVASVCHAVAFFICVILVTYPGERNCKFQCKRTRTREVETCKNSI